MEWYNEILGFLALVVNSMCFRYAYKTFDIKLCTNYILCADSALTFISSGLTLSTSLANSTDTIVCSIHTLGFLIIPYTFPTYNFIMVYTRYKRISTSMNGGMWKSNSQLIRITNRMVFAMITLICTQIFTNGFFELKQLLIYNVCTKSEKEVELHVLQIVLFGGYRVVISILTIAIDIACLVLVRELAKKPNPGSNDAREEKRNILNETPMRSSILTLLYFLNILAVIPFMASDNYTKVEKLDISQTVLFMIFMVKSPWIIFWTFRVNSTNARVDQDKERERLRQLEIQDATKRRNERIAYALSKLDHPAEIQVQNNAPVRRTSSLARIIYVKEYCPQKCEPCEIVLQPLDLLENVTQNV